MVVALLDERPKFKEKIATDNVHDWVDDVSVPKVAFSRMKGYRYVPSLFNIDVISHPWLSIAVDRTKLQVALAEGTGTPSAAGPSLFLHRLDDSRR